METVNANINQGNINEKHQKIKRKYAAIKKAFVSVENAEEEERKNAKGILERAKNINLIKTLKVDTPWTTGSSDEGSNHYLYYKIQQAKKSKHEYSKFEKIYSFLNKMNIIQVDFHSLMKEYTYNKESNALYQKAKLMLNEAQISHKPSSLLMRRKLKVKSSSTADSIDEKHESYECN